MALTVRFLFALHAIGAPKGDLRVWSLMAPASGLNDASAARHWSLYKYLVDAVVKLSRVGLRFEASSPGPRLF